MADGGAASVATSGVLKMRAFNARVKSGSVHAPIPAAHKKRKWTLDAARLMEFLDVNARSSLLDADLRFKL